MKKIYFMGLGKTKPCVEFCLRKENVNIIAFIDNGKAGEQPVLDGIPVIKQREIEVDFDYIVVSLLCYENVRMELISQGIPIDKIICFYDFENAENIDYWEILEPSKWKTELIWRHYRHVTIPTIDNMPYELYADSPQMQLEYPHIVDIKKTVELLKNEKKSLARFGDGEFELINKRFRANFQQIDEDLSEKLKQALNSQMDNLLIAIADNYGKLDKYTSEAAEAIRSYLKKDVRTEQMKLLDMGREYHNAYLSRPYIMYRDKSGVEEHFKLIKSIWKQQDILIVEGQYTRFGVGNDLLDNALSVIRVLAPDKNAFSRYEEILAEARKWGKGRLILTTLGPTATVMAYELAKEGFWIIDIGQLDVEYEWYLRGVTERCNIPYKRVSEGFYLNDIVTDESVSFIKQYKDEIVSHILN